MPELPEAEANRRRIEAGALHRTIEGFEANNTTHLDIPGENERGRLVGHQFTETRRHGKLIFAGSKTGPWIAVHLGMTGSLHTYDAPRDRPDHAWFQINFEGDRRLIFYNKRKLGWLHVAEDPADYVKERDFGPDALEIDADAFAERVGGTNGAIKSALIQQKKVAGVGNLWSDEILYRTGVMSDATAKDLPREKIGEIYETMRDVLETVSETDMDYSKLPDDWLIHRREVGATCGICGGKIKKKTVGGRTAYHCPDHQGED